MKHQYFGDINDYRKYGLLRSVASAGQLRVGVCWMLTPDDGRTDGEFRRYLEEPGRLRRHDPELHDELRKLLDPGTRRSVHHAEAWELIPTARYHRDEVPVGAKARSAYILSALEALKDSDLIFFDPDNGLEVRSVGRGSAGAPKYVWVDEVEEAYRRGHSVLLYQHYPRRPRREFELELCDRLGTEAGAHRVDLFSTAHVAFIGLSHARHGAGMQRATDHIISAWAPEIRHRIVSR